MRAENGQQKITPLYNSQTLFEVSVLTARLLKCVAVRLITIAEKITLSIDYIKYKTNLSVYVQHVLKFKNIITVIHVQLARPQERGIKRKQISIVYFTQKYNSYRHTCVIKGTTTHPTTEPNTQNTEY
jgi:hypothetical protein